MIEETIRCMVLGGVIGTCVGVALNWAVLSQRMVRPR